jgi:hypothetical protein
LPHAFELFLDALLGQDVPLVGAREAALRSSVMEAMYEAAKTETWVDMNRQPAQGRSVGCSNSQYGANRAGLKPPR